MKPKHRVLLNSLLLVGLVGAVVAGQQSSAQALFSKRGTYAEECFGEGCSREERKEVWSNGSYWEEVIKAPGPGDFEEAREIVGWEAGALGAEYDVSSCNAYAMVSQFIKDDFALTKETQWSNRTVFYQACWKGRVSGQVWE